jgi:membrane protease YdiL (CAAX protease family)
VLSVQVTKAIFAPFSSPIQAEQAYTAAVFGSVIAWWLLAVARPTHRAGVWDATPVAVLKQAAKVAACGMLTSLLCTLAVSALGVSRAGFAAPPSVLADELAAQSVALVVFLVGVLAPVAEEMLFRGFLFRRWRPRWGPSRWALVTSAVFALGHPNVPAVFLHALAATVLYTTTRTIVAPIVAHVLNNLIVLLVLHAVGFLPPILLEATMDGRWHVAAAVPAVLGTWWLIRFVRQGWHTLGDPVHGVLIAPVEIGIPARAAQVHSAHKHG